MASKRKKRYFLLDYIESKQKERIFYITREETIKDINTSHVSFNGAARLLCEKNKLYKLHPDFYIIVPFEFQDEKCPPPDMFFDSFMRFLDVNYYISLFSAAAFYQNYTLAVPEFQAMIPKLRHPIRTPSYTIRYFTKKHWPSVGINRVRTSYGFLNISSPELTAFDLLKYCYTTEETEILKKTLQCFSKKLDANQLVKLAETMDSPRAEIIHWQRLGYILDEIGQTELTDPLAQWIRKINPRSGYLNPPKPDKYIHNEDKNTKWKLLINKNL